MNLNQRTGMNSQLSGHGPAWTSKCRMKNLIIQLSVDRSYQPNPLEKNFILDNKTEIVTVHLLKKEGKYFI